MRHVTCAFLLASSLSPTVVAQPLEELTRVKPAVSARVTSASPDPNSNSDNTWIKPGETRVIADITGSGVIDHIWFTFADSGPSWISKAGAADPSEVVLRMYWDGSKDPAVEAPVGDFFACGFGRRAEVNSTPVIVQGGDSYNCFWKMPFRSAAKITLTNESEKPMAALYYQIDFTKERSLPEDTAYFCAQYRQEFPTQLGHDYLLADIEAPDGGGHYVGTVLSVRSRSPQWFGEGDDKFFIDDDPPNKPSLWGTGTEDYFLNAWGMEKGCFPMFGVTQLEGGLGEIGEFGTMYRWHLSDPVRFRKSLKVVIEHAGWMSADETTTGKVEGFVEREDDFASVAFWYQKGQPKRFATMPSAKERRFPSIDTAIEGKDLLAHATANQAKLSLQKGSMWTGDGQVFINATQGASVEIEFEIPGAPASKPLLVVTHSYDFGIYRLSVDSKPVGDEIDFYSASVETHEHALADAALTPGKHTLKLDCIGKNPASKGWKLGVDSIRLRHRWDKKRPPLAPAKK